MPARGGKPKIGSASTRMKHGVPSLELRGRHQNVEVTLPNSRGNAELSEFITWSLGDKMKHGSP